MRKIGYYLTFSFLLLFVIIVLYPLILVVINSFKSETEYMNSSPFALPAKFTFDVMIQTWNRVDFTQKFVNSFIISFSVAIVTVTVSFLNGFAMSILKVPGKIVFLFLFMIGMMVPQESLVYPIYNVFKILGIYNTRFSVILILSGLNIAYGTYLIATVLKTFPQSYIDAAKIDGCSKFATLWKIVFPVSRSVVSVLWVFSFIWTWNDFFMSLIFLVSNSIQTMPLAMVIFQGQHDVNITMRSAASLITAIPCVVFFFIFMKTISRGIISTGIKE
jgi:raffinose/stachyose/melibiose transport system permease protein